MKNEIVYDESMTVIEHYYVPDTHWKLYVLEKKDLMQDDKQFYGLVHGDEIEYGYFTLSGMFNYFGFRPVVLDLEWEPDTLYNLGLTDEYGKPIENPIKES